MLLLTRKKGEKIVIGDNVYVTVVEVKGDQVQIGIEAPEKIPVHREEIFKEIQEENIRAKASATLDLKKAQELIKKQEEK